jgi:acetyltransferase-like isoleucine patch superfamily enzyme
MKDFFHVCYNVARSSNSDVNVPLFLLKSGQYHCFSKNIFAHHNTSIKGLRNIETRGQLFVGTPYVGFLNKHDRTFLNIKGKLLIEGTVLVGKGCRLDICKGAVCTLRGCSITGQTNLIIAHSLEIGEGTVISWGCELADEDWHDIKYEGKQGKDHAIVVGNHVWIGSYVKILKGVHIGDNSVIASSSVVTGSFTEGNLLIAGNPAEIIKREVEWQ